MLSSIIAVVMCNVNSNLPISTRLNKTRINRH